MIPGHAEVRTIARDHRTVDDGRALLDDVGREDRHVGLVDDRRGQYGSERPVVRDREGRAADVGRRERAGAGGTRERVDATRDPQDVERLGVANYRDEETLLVE